jgi:transcriptional regulator with GAF, ATPase, and Fis domain
MREKAERVKNLVATLADLIGRETDQQRQSLETLIAFVKVLESDTGDKRLQRIVANLKTLQENIELLARMTLKDFLVKLQSEVEIIASDCEDHRAVNALQALLGLRSPSLNAFCEAVLDRLLEATNAERGLFLYYRFESTEAEILAARNYQTKNLSLAEYGFSRTLLREACERGASLLIEDALRDPAYSKEESVRAFALKSILAVPLKQNERAVGALYFENNSQPCAFNEEDLHLLSRVASFVVFYLHHARLLPFAFQETSSRVYFDVSRASREIIGQDPKLLAALEVVQRIADSRAPVLIEGESGTGKELIARALHFQSARRNHPFIAINCAAIPETLLESELFGHERGAFTGATERHIGLIEQADGGTLFLDEVNELAYSLQAKLLRFLQSQEFYRLGGKETTRVDVRVVAATSKNLKEMSGAGKFQEALFYRLNVIPITLPALRERPEDIPVLADYFREKFNSIYDKNTEFGPEVYECLAAYSFPGNVRELENLVHRLVALARDETIRMGDLPREFLNIDSEKIKLVQDPLARLLLTEPQSLEDVRRRRSQIRRLLTEQENQLIERTLKETNGNMAEAARRLGLNRVTLHKILRRKDNQSNETNP